MSFAQDAAGALPGYWPSAWPVECGGNRRQKVVPSPGLNIQPGEQLQATVRRTDHWNVMFVQRDEGELYLHGTTCGLQEDTYGWVEKVDPITLEPVASTGPLPCGGHEWCGAAVVHANGDIYTVNGSYLHRLDPNCNIVAESTMPSDQAYNGLLVLPDGNIVTKDLMLYEPTTIAIVDPNSMQVIASIQTDEPSMGRIAADVAADGAWIYGVASEHLYRYKWDGSTLTKDDTWNPRYRESGQDDQGLAWDVTLVDDDVWLQDNGSIPGVQFMVANHPTGPAAITDSAAGPSMETGWGAQRVVRVSQNDPNDTTVIAPFDIPEGWIIAPPLVYDGILVAFDSGNERITGTRVAKDGTLDILWDRPFCNLIQPMVYQDTRELVISDERVVDGQSSDDVVVLDLDTGAEKGRASIGVRGNGMFFCPGWQRDFYYCTWFSVARLHVEGR